LYLGNIAHANGDTESAITYYREAAQTQGDIGQQANDQLALIEMSQAPNRYILNRLTLDSNGYLLLSVYNRSNIPATGVVVQVTEMTSTYVTGPSVQITIGALSANTQKTVSTRIGPIKDAATLNRYQALVITAKPVISS
ncbi:MAG: hypothetical protein P1U52_04645, partial [Porticoccaceae bacterium]|nr:hypothetical protein [Porticoccaceae bacterium]